MIRRDKRPRSNRVYQTRKAALTRSGRAGRGQGERRQCSCSQNSTCGPKIETSVYMVIGIANTLAVYYRWSFALVFKDPRKGESNVSSSYAGSRYFQRP